MRSIPLVLVLDDVVADLRVMDAALRALGYETIAARDPASLLRRLVTVDAVNGRRELTSNVPVLGVLDYEMHHAPDSSLRVEELLAFLFEHHPNCRVLMYSSMLDRSDVRERINQAHPLALVEDKHGDNAEALAHRVHRTMGRRVGDLEIVGSRLRFNHPTDPRRSRYLTHHVRYLLVSHYPGSVYISRLNDQKMARRFRADLARLGSCMTVRALGGKRFQLVEAHSAGADAR
jgi:CheY-like chemotaxis protein